MPILDFFKKGEKDPVCGMKIDPATAGFKSVRDGKTHYFCSASCKETFDKEKPKSSKGGCCAG